LFRGCRIRGLTIEAASRLLETTQKMGVEGLHGIAESIVNSEANREDAGKSAADIAADNMRLLATVLVDETTAAQMQELTQMIHNPSSSKEALRWRQTYAS
jgi:hypothetical protein